MSSVAKKMLQASAGNSVDANLEFIGQKWGQSTVTVTRGVDYEDGDLLFSYMYSFTGTPATPESGWTVINTGGYSIYTRIAFTYRIANASSYTTNNGNFDNAIVIFRPTGYNTYTEVDEDVGAKGATASITMTDTNDSLYMGFSSDVGRVFDLARPSFVTHAYLTGSSSHCKFYWAYQEAGHGNTGTQNLDIRGTMQMCTAAQLDLT